MEYCIKCGDKIDEHELCEVCVENKYRQSILTASEYSYIHTKECSKYKECEPKCHFWGLCGDKTMAICNINSAICVAEDIKEGVLK